MAEVCRDTQSTGEVELLAISSIAFYNNGVELFSKRRPVSAKTFESTWPLQTLTWLAPNNSHYIILQINRSGIFADHKCLVWGTLASYTNQLGWNDRVRIQIWTQRFSQLGVQKKILKMLHGSKVEVMQERNAFTQRQTRHSPDHCCRYWNIARNGRATSLKHFLDTTMAKNPWTIFVDSTILVNGYHIYSTACNYNNSVSNLCCSCWDASQVFLAVANFPPLLGPISSPGLKNMSGNPPGDIPRSGTGDQGWL